VIAITLLLIRFQAYLTAALNEIECALVIQMACTYSAAMAVLSRLRGEPPGTELSLGVSAAARLLRASQVDALRP
jgi:hypothetical protein